MRVALVSRDGLSPTLTSFRAVTSATWAIARVHWRASRTSRLLTKITSALDASVQAAIVRLLEDLQEREHLALLFVTHNLALVRTIADRVIVLNQGRVVEAGSTEEVVLSPSDAYTKALIADAPSFATTA